MRDGLCCFFFIGPQIGQVAASARGYWTGPKGGSRKTLPRASDADEPVLIGPSRLGSVRQRFRAAEFQGNAMPP